MKWASLLIANPSFQSHEGKQGGATPLLHPSSHGEILEGQKCTLLPFIGVLAYEDDKFLVHQRNGDFGLRAARKIFKLKF